MVAVCWVAGTAAEEVVAHWEKAVAWGVVTAAPLVWEVRDVASAAASAAKGREPQAVGLLAVAALECPWRTPT